MTNEEMVKALRYCSTQDCIDCAAGKYFGYGNCLERLVAAAADLIERLTAENAKLLEYAKLFAGCDTCKRRNYCKSDSACDECEQDAKGNCYCKDCERGSKWEWRGLPEAPAEGEKA